MILDFFHSKNMGLKTLHICLIFVPPLSDFGPNLPFMYAERDFLKSKKRLKHEKKIFAKISTLLFGLEIHIMKVLKSQEMIYEHGNS